MKIFCPICESTTPESQERLKEIARIGLARFLSIAHNHGVAFAREQKRDICDALLTWNTYGVPGEVDWLVHEHAIRAACCAEASFDADSALVKAITSGPDWNANYYEQGIWDIEAENLQAQQLKLLFGEAPADD